MTMFNLTQKLGIALALAMCTASAASAAAESGYGTICHLSTKKITDFDARYPEYYVSAPVVGREEVKAIGVKKDFQSQDALLIGVWLKSDQVSYDVTVDPGNRRNWWNQAIQLPGDAILNLTPATERAGIKGMWFLEGDISFKNGGRTHVYSLCRVTY